jgi:hypothetical protein
MSRIALALLLCVTVTGCGDSFIEGILWEASGDATTDDLDPPSVSTSGSGTSSSTTPGSWTSESSTGEPAAPPEIIEFLIDPPTLDAAGLVHISAKFSPSVIEAVISEEYEGERRELAAFDMEGVGALEHELAFTAYGVNGTHELYVQGLNAEGVSVQQASAVEVTLPAGGTQLWHHVDDDPATIFSSGVDVAVHDGGVIVLGAAYLDLQLHLIARRYSADQALEWTFVSDYGVMPTAMTVDAKGDVIVVGKMTTGESSRMWMHKLNANGLPIWKVSVKGEPGTIGLDVTTDEDGWIYVVGTRTRVDPNDVNKHEDDAVIGKFSELGAPADWVEYDNNEFDEWTDDRATSVVVLANGRVLIAGTTAALGQNNNNVTQALVLEYTFGQLNPLWSAAKESWNASAAHAIAGDGSGGIVLAGWTQVGQDEPMHLSVRRLNGSLEPLWAYPGFELPTPVGEAFALVRDPAGRFIAGGSVEGSEAHDAHVFVMEDHGGPGWRFTNNNPGSADESITAVATDPLGYVYYTGVTINDGLPRLLLGKLNP